MPFAIVQLVDDPRMVLRSDWIHGFYRSMWVENLMV
jgi:hypothetical protein